MKLAVPGSGNLTYVACIADDLRDQAMILLGELARGAPDFASDAAPLRLDWGIVKLERRGDEVWVSEPDYRDDARHFVSGLNFTSAVLRAQQRVHDHLGASAEPVRYDQSVLFYPRASSAERIAAVRQSPQTASDSGWRVFDIRQIDWAAEPQARYVYQLAGDRPPLLAVLSLPVGWSVQLEGATLTQAAPPDSGALMMEFPVGL